MLRPHSGYTLCFSAADMMQPDLSAAFYRAVLVSTADPAAGKLTQLLDGLDHVRDKPGQDTAPSGGVCAER